MFGFFKKTCLRPKTLAFSLLTLLVLALLSSLPGTSLVAAESAAADSAEVNRVYDLAEALEPDQIPALNASLTQIAEDYGQEVIVLVTDDLEGHEARDYADLFYYDLYPDQEQNGGVFLYVVKQELYILTSGQLIDVVTDADIENLLDLGWDDFVLGDYASSSHKMLGGLKDLLDRGVVAGHQRMDESERKEAPQKSLGTLDILAALGISGLSGLGFVGSTKKSYKPQTRKPSYLVAQNSLLSLHQDVNNLVNKQIRMIPVPPPSESSGKSYNSRTTSTTFKGSSGSTRGGGGRKL